MQFLMWFNVKGYYNENSFKPSCEVLRSPLNLQTFLSSRLIKNAQDEKGECQVKMWPYF